MSEITIRPAQRSHLGALLNLLGQLEEAISQPASAAHDLIESNVCALVDDPSARVLVAEMDGAVVGAINFSMRRTALHPGRSALIDELVVDRNRRGRGIGRLLIDAALAEARRAECCEVEVSTEKSNEAARHFYKTCGFEEAAVLLEKDL